MSGTISIYIKNAPALLLIGIAVVGTFFVANCIASWLERLKDRRLERKVAQLVSGRPPLVSSTLSSAAAGSSSSESPSEEEDAIPVTIITGFLGAGKTVLLNRLLAEPGGRRICVIENEAGAISVDHALLAQKQDDADVVVLQNGCMCCSASGPGNELERTLDRLLKLREAASKSAASISTASTSSVASRFGFNYLVIELSGLADPGPVVSTFLRPDVSSRFYVDSVVAVVDAKNVANHLAGKDWASRTGEAAAQIAYADQILLNKVDVATPTMQEAAVAAIREVNPAAAILHTAFCAVPADKILGVGAFDVDAASSLLVSGLRSPGAGSGTGAACAHTDTRAITLRPAGPLLLPPLREWLQSVIATHWRQLYRVKGILWATDGSGPHVPAGKAVKTELLTEGHAPLPFVVHGVHADLQGGFDESLARPGSAAVAFTPALVLIGRGLRDTDEARLRREFNALPLASGSVPAAPAESACCDGQHGEGGHGHSHGASDGAAAGGASAARRRRGRSPA